jgi:hypothetical protein
VIGASGFFSFPFMVHYQCAIHHGQALSPLSVKVLLAALLPLPLVGGNNDYPVQIPPLILLFDYSNSYINSILSGDLFTTAFSYILSIISGPHIAASIAPQHHHSHQYQNQLSAGTQVLLFTLKGGSWPLDLFATTAFTNTDLRRAYLFFLLSLLLASTSFRYLYYACIHSVSELVLSHASCCSALRNRQSYSPEMDGPAKSHRRRCI